MRAFFLSLAVTCGLFFAFTLVAVADEGKPSTKVEGTFTISKEVPSFEGRLVEIRLYKHDPRLADKAADAEGVASDGVLVGAGQPCGLADAAVVGEVGQYAEGLGVGEAGRKNGVPLRSEKRSLQERQ